MFYFWYGAFFAYAGLSMKLYDLPTLLWSEQQERKQIWGHINWEMRVRDFMIFKKKTIFGAFAIVNFLLLIEISVISKIPDNTLSKFFF